MKNYTYKEKKYYFDNIRFKKLMSSKYHSKKLYGCQKVAEAINKLAPEPLVSEKPRTVYGWLHPDNGRYTSPNCIEVITYLAQALDVPVEDLLIESEYIKMINTIPDNPNFEEMSPDEILKTTIWSYKATNGYNYISKDSDEDGLDFWIKVVDIAADKIKQESKGEAENNLIRLCLCEAIKDFIKSQEYADGLSDLFFRKNPNLKYYTSPYELIEESMEAFVNSGLKYLFIPSYEDIIAREKYFDSMRISHNDADKDTLFMEELAKTVSNLYNNA